MDAIIQAFFRAATERRVATHNWQPGTPFQQPYYAYSPENKKWRGVSPPSKPPASVAHSSKPTPLTTFTVLSWNIDFMLPLGNERLEAALTYVHTLIQRQDPPGKPCVVLLQEMTNADLRVIQAQPWIRDGFYVTDISNEYWAGNTYGTCTLIPKTLAVLDVFRVHYEDTVMERDGLFVDFDVGAGEGRRCLRICNTHLESLALEPPRRPAQLACAARFMKGEYGGPVLGSVLGGDLNAIQPFDKTIAGDNGLEDAYIACGGEEGREDCFTWGQMARTREREKFGLSRMDKLLFHGGVEVERFERVGYGVEIEGEKNQEELRNQGLEKPWVTDHLGVKGDFRLVLDHGAGGTA